jgi:NADPH:quinone reductase-like Zn-dependent oxidoreductase
MKAVRLNELGGPEKLHIETIPDPVPGAGEIAVKIHRAAFNRRDIFITQGLYPGIELPRTLGSDGAGVVAAVNVHKKPAHLSDDEAAAIPLAGLTAYRALITRGRCTSADSVLITGIGGGVQTFALLFAKHIGAKVVVTSSSDEKLARAKTLGADVTINYKQSENWSKEARSAAGGGGPSLVIDSAGGDTFAKCLNIARPAARVVTYGGTLGDAKVRMFDIFWKHLDIMGTSMGSPQDFAGMLALFETGLRPAVDEVVPMDEAAAAAERINKSEQFGKVVLAIS